MSDTVALSKDLSMNDYDINQALDWKDLHGNLALLTILG